jgi:SAM-dependent methyltransferase
MPGAGRRYERIGHGYARLRREDPRIAARIEAALSNARTVVNVGAGAGSYEPRDRYVVAVEPSDVMAAQRPPELPPAIKATAGRLPLRDNSLDAAMAILTVHHWDQEREAGVRELRRVARGPVVILTYLPEVSNRMWLVEDYVPEVGEMDERIFPDIDELSASLGGHTRVETLPIHRDSPDWMFGSFWAHPERVLDPEARSVTSGFARLPAEVIARVEAALEADLRRGEWDRRHGHLRRLQSLDVGLRLVVGTPG